MCQHVAWIYNYKAIITQFNNKLLAAMATTEIKGKLLKATSQSAGDKGRRQFIHWADCALSPIPYAMTYHFGIAKGKIARCPDPHRTNHQGLPAFFFFFH